MAVDLSFFQSETSQQLRREGRDQGVIEGRVQARAECIVDILRRRGVEVSGSDWERILSGKDEKLLDIWFERAFTATSVDELWDAPEAPQPASSAG